MKQLETIDRLSDPVEELTAGPRGEKLDQLASLAPSRPRELRLRLQRTSRELIEIALLVSHGFAHRNDGARDPHLATRGRWGAPMTNDDVAKHALRMVAQPLAAELEHFARALAHWWLTPHQLAMAMARIQNHKGRCPKDIPTDPAKARRHLIQKYVTPSRFPPNTWPGRLRLVFGASMPKPLATCLVALARLRHEFAHRHNPPRPIDWMNGPDLSDVLNTLFLSAVALSNLLAAQARNR